MNEAIVIIGAGQAGLKAAETLRQQGYEGGLILIGDEPHPPYQRPPLSKAYLKGELPRERLFLKADNYYKDCGIELRTNCRVTEIDPAAHRITLQNGATLRYSKLLLATGTRARKLPIEGADLVGVHTLRGIEDTELLAEALSASDQIAIIGGGYIGMEFAAVARAAGRQVSVIEAQDRILKRSVAAEISTYFQDLHRREGVQLLLDRKVLRIKGHDRAEAVELVSGEVVPAQLVLVAAGAEPCIELAVAAGLKTGRGILVDGACRTSMPDIFAAGDCTEFHSMRFGRTITLESVQNASDQGKASALSMLGKSVSYDPVPWFWSDQFKERLQITGLSEGADRTELAGEPQSGSFALRYYKSDRLIAVDAVNAPRLHMAARKELAEDAPGPGDSGNHTRTTAEKPLAPQA